MAIEITDPRIAALLTAWHENGRESFARSYPDTYAHGGYDGSSHVKTAKDRKKYIALDDGTSGAFLVEKATERIFCIKGYGVIDRRKPVGTVDSLTVHYLEATATHRAGQSHYMRPVSSRFDARPVEVHPALRVSAPSAYERAQE